MQNLLVGINSLGANTLGYLHKTTKFGELKQMNEMLLLRDAYDPNSVHYSFTAIGFSSALEIVSSNSDIKDKDALLSLIQKAKKVIVFIGVGGTFSNTLLKKLMEIVDRTKLSVVAIMPFSFEGKAKDALAQEMLQTLTQTNIGVALYDNNELLDSKNSLGVVARMEQFFDKIVSETFYNQEGGYIGI